MLKKLIRHSFTRLGYEVRKLHPFAMPVELTSDEVKLVESIMKMKITMVGYERLCTTLMACKHIIEQKIDGDFVECGVWRGGNAILAASMFKMYGCNKRVWLFDTFEGMTAPTQNDRSIPTGESAQVEYELNRRDTHNEWCYASIDDVKQNFSSFDCLGENVIFVKGDVTKTLDSRSILPQQIAVLRLDTDWYVSTKKELEVLYPRLSIGGILIIDDYGHWSGSKKATDEYFDHHGNRPFLQYTDYTGRVAVKVDYPKSDLL